jgi:hypothetical protein
VRLILSKKKEENIKYELVLKIIHYFVGMTQLISVWTRKKRETAANSYDLYVHVSTITNESFWSCQTCATFLCTAIHKVPMYWICEAHKGETNSCCCRFFGKVAGYQFLKFARKRSIW